MRKFLGPGLIFLLSLFVSLLLNMPLVHVLAQIKIPDHIRMANVQATLLSGQIDILEVNGLQATNLKYGIDWRCLLELQLCYRIDFNQGQGLISASAIDQNLTISNTSISYPMEELAAPFPQLFIKPSGNLKISIDTLIIKQKKLALKKGEVTWEHAGVVGDSVDLGEYRLNINLVNQSYQFDLNDNKALLKVDGNGRINSNGQFSANINIASQPGLQQSVKAALEFVARKKGLNQYTVQQTGQLPKQILSQLSFEDG